MLVPSPAVGEMQPWATPSTQQVFQMPQVTYPNSHSPTNGAWGNPTWSQHHKGRAQPQYGDYRRRQQNYRESKRASESNLPAAPAPWHAAVPNSGVFQEQEGQEQGPAAVNLQDLPVALCRQNLLEAMMDQAGLTGKILGCILGQDQDMGKALITLTDRNAAQRCAAHFHGCTWSNGPPVMAQVVDAPIGQSGTQAKSYGDNNNGLEWKDSNGKTRKARSGKIRNAPWKMETPELPYAAVFQPGWEGFAEIADGGYSKQDSDDLEQVSTDAGGSSPARSAQDLTGFCGCDTDDGF